MPANRNTAPRSRPRYRRSRQRDRILGLLRSTGSHPTAAWLYGKLRREFPHLSMGTVYRNLWILVDQGLAAKIDHGSTFDRFDANMRPHYHFICEQCGAIFDLDLPMDTAINDRLKSSPHRVRRHEIEFFGLCQACAASAG